MPLSRRQFNNLVLTGLVVASAPEALKAEELKEGQDWRAIKPPQPSDVPGKIEVLEFFSYGCPHCSSLNPLAKAWAKKQPEDVAFRRVPVTFGRRAWANLARLYYSLEIMNSLERLDQEIFDAIHEQRLKLYAEPAMIDWLKGKDIDTDRFSEVFKSFDVETKLGRADYLAGRYVIDAVPTITVGGRYAVLARRAKTLPETLEIADRLVEKARLETPPA
ncbi:thiol:disulfide interchange protein DsbA/DsbL [Thiorhodococcus mannitoliphagus]|uniref:Thiol:disulfide interchange protein n=1 Tax=Thiorhodococcus mannitoliphagus TaxID=329406 RepID=A0A6P1DPW5_9GAMM|nr:thiol:disulfide interchange protein DsbA/DsbL [Thiorhodococcus mannitoliphagus]NEX20317.1 thiol:disulfide interchange protein DsbA/DsbL [Thiorhodococcus mannitoliphagus]